ncbi:MAG TPA: DUF6600 domain-containing protein [Candidatus Elarobacter sp.]|jgi:hypothetical protein|nr:DUF6600 domain-containing protein [Candidatus Elarobacter sp.]
MHSSTIRRRASALVAALILPLAAPLAARADGGDAAGAGVARISYVQGTVSVQRGDSAAPVDAALNAPVLGADYLTTGPSSRAEVELDGRSAIRLGEDVQMRFAHLDASGREVQLAQGTIDLRVLGSPDPRTDVDTPSVTVHPAAAGSYRVTVAADGRTYITARSGRAEVVSPQGTRDLDPGSTLIAQGTAANPSIETVEAVALDGFDQFNGERDARLERALAATQPYVNPNLQGVDDLDTYGRWVNDGQYGEVWVPTNVATDWAPYRDGRWVWEDSYGWTWLGYEPWGWAPYHYGRWYRSAAYGWAWFPPAASVVTVWSPALVAFVGFGGGFGFGFGNIGWVPVAPFEPFYPWWRRGGGTTIVNNVTIVNNNYGQFSHVYRNALAGGVTGISHQRFLQGRFDHPVAVSPSQLRTVHVAHGSLPVVPSAANLRFGDRASAGTSVAMRPAFQRSFAGTGAVDARTPFEQQRAALATHVAPAAVHTSATRATTDPWTRFGNARGSSVQVIDGASDRGAATMRTRAAANAVQSSGTSKGDAWSRFDNASQGRPRVTSTQSQIPSYARPQSTNDTGAATRTYDGGGTRTRAYGSGAGANAAAGARARTYDPGTRSASGGAQQRQQSSGQARARSSTSRASGGGGHHGG